MLSNIDNKLKNWLFSLKRPTSIANGGMERMDKMTYLQTAVISNI